MSDEIEGHKSVLEWISSEYHGMNGSCFETLESPPSSVEFSRICRISRPALIKGYAIPGVQAWSDAYLSEAMGERMISVAVTPNGYADAITAGAHGKKYFAEPYVEHTTMKSLLERLNITRESAEQDTTEVFYLQSQNGNIFSSDFFEPESGNRPSELEPLRGDVPTEIPWCSEALGRHPDAVNLWIGNNRSVTSIHNDPYENIYQVVRGQKTFTLLPPTEGWCLEERRYPHATYTRSEADAPLTLTPSPPDTPMVRWSSITQPDSPGALSPHAHPITVSVSAGETLYLPAGWWHHVRQSSDITVALNWWYDIEPRGMMWVWLNLLRGVGDVPPGNFEDEDTQRECP